MVYRRFNIDGSDTGEECRLKCELESTSGYANNQFRHARKPLPCYTRISVIKARFIAPTRPNAPRLSTVSEEADEGGQMPYRGV